MFKSAIPYQYSFEAAQDFSNHQFKFVKLNSSGKIVLAQPGDTPFGILVSANIKNGQVGNVVTYGGGQELVAEKAITVGQAVVVGENGTGVGVGLEDPRPKVGIAKTSATANKRFDCDLEFLGAGNYYAATAKNNLSGHTNKFVKLDSNGQLELCDTADEGALGILLSSPRAGEIGVVATAGARASLIAKTTLNLGALLATNNQGQGIAASAGKRIAARAIEAAASAGDTISVIVLDGTA